MTVPPANPPCPGGIIASWSGTAYSTRQAWLISQLTSISEGLSPIRHPGTRLVGDGRPTTELEVAYSRVRIFWVHGMECMCAQTRPQFILSSERVFENGVRTHVNSKGEIPSAGGSEEDWTHDAASRRTANPIHYWLGCSGLLLDIHIAVASFSVNHVIKCIAYRDWASVFTLILKSRG